MIKRSLLGLMVCLSLVTNAWALTPVLDTGDPNERVCNPKSYTDLGNGIVRDNVTGLEWQQATAPGTYTWQQALDYVTGMNAGTNENYGYTDWRLPTIEELSTLVDAGRHNPAIDPIFSTVASDCWSSTTDAYDTGLAWTVDFDGGSVYDGIKADYGYVRAVRSGQYGPLDNLVINGDGTVTDTDTGLMWQQCNYGQTWSGTACTGSTATRTWDQAVAYVQGLNTTHYLGYDDWRLPTSNELQSLIDYSRYNPATTFPNTVASYYWSSIPFAFNSSFAWIVDFYYGSVHCYDKSSNSYVRAVRSGQCLSSNWCDDNDCEEGKYCDEANDRCVDCMNNTDCDDGVSCNGVETCTNGVCVAGTSPCPVGTACDSTIDQCVAMSCTEHRDCPEGFNCVEGTCTEEAPPVITGGPWLATGGWWVLPTSPSNNFVLDQNYFVLWTFSDDYTTCAGLCTNRAKYRRLDGTQWFEMQATMDKTGKKFAFVELPVNNMRDGDYVFQMEVVDCVGQITSSPYYYFKVEHPL